MVHTVGSFGPARGRCEILHVTPFGEGIDAMFEHHRSGVAAGTVLLLSYSCCAQCQPQWLPADGLPGVNGTVYASTLWDPDGPGPEPPLLVIGGSFLYAGGSLATNVAFWNGTSWAPLGSGLGGQGISSDYSLAVFQGDLIAAGSFSLTGGSPVPG